MIDFLLSPLTWLAFALLALVLFGRRMRVAMRRALQCLALVALFACTPLCANALLWLAERHPGISGCGTAQADWPIVLLSAGFERPPRGVQDDAALNKENFERIEAARLLASADAMSPLYVSGGGPGRIAESIVIADVLVRDGIARDRIHAETRSRTTWENAFMLHDVVTRARLVTSPAHLQRAATAFNAAGIQTCAVASNSGLVAMDGIGYVLPRRTALAKSEQALHELIGRAGYAWRAWRVHAASSRS